jgi:hypothetical protein
MEDNEFVVELARRINTFFEQDEDRTRAVLSTPIPAAGYASVAHFLGELCMPKGIKDLNPSEMGSKNLLVPKVKDGKLLGVEVVTMDEFKKAFEKPEDPPVH